MKYLTFNQFCEDFRSIAGLDADTFVNYSTSLDDELGIKDDALVSILNEIQNKYNIKFISDDFKKNLVQSILIHIGRFIINDGILTAGVLYEAICKAKYREVKLRPNNSL